MRAILFSTILVLAGCSMFEKEQIKQVKPSYTSISQKRMQCIDKLIKLDVKPLDAGQLCQGVYQQR